MDEHLAASRVQLTASERNMNAARALLRLIPSVGDSIDQLAFGALDELRQKRVEQMLEEILGRLDAISQPPSKAEEFANLFESALPQIARAVDDNQRARLCDLLTNAAVLPPGDARWAEANLCARLIAELDPPSLATIAQIARYDGPSPAALVSAPTSQVVSEASFDWSHPSAGPWQIGYVWPVVEECARRLRDKRLISFTSHNGTNGAFEGVYLLPLGSLLVGWAVSDAADSE
jgi:hypothetical protein